MMCFTKKQIKSLVIGIKIFFRNKKVVWFKGWNLQKIDSWKSKLKIRRKYQRKNKIKKAKIK